MMTIVNLVIHAYFDDQQSPPSPAAKIGKLTLSITITHGVHFRPQSRL